MMKQASLMILNLYRPGNGDDVAWDKEYVGRMNIGHGLFVSGKDKEGLSETGFIGTKVDGWNAHTQDFNIEEETFAEEGVVSGNSVPQYEQISLLK